MKTVMYREITPHSDVMDRWNDVTINAGASQCTLQDIKILEGAGCFTYRNSGDLTSCCSNRFIYWRTNHDVIELVEVSMDLNLKGSHLRLRFQNTPILRGVSVHESGDKVVLLVATVSAIHKITFPHPTSLDGHEFQIKKTESSSPSIFYDTTNVTLRSRSCFSVLQHVSLGIPLPHTSCSWLETNGSAVFILANTAGSVMMLVMSDRNGVEISTTELMKTGSFFRIFNGFVPNAIRNNKTEAAMNLVCHQTSTDVLIFSLFTDLQIRIWSFKKQECLLVDSIQNYDSEKNLNAGSFTTHQCHLRKSVCSSTNDFILGVYVPVSQRKVFYIFKPQFIQDRCKLLLLSTLHQTQHDLVDFCVSDSHIWTLWLSCENQPIVYTAEIDSCQRSELQSSWIPVCLEPRVSHSIDYESSNPQDNYLREIFKVGRFLPSTIAKAISICQSTRNSTILSNVSMQADNLKNRVLAAIEGEILMKIGDVDPNDPEYLEAAMECWDRFFSNCIQYHEVGMKPLGISVDPFTGFVIVIKKIFYSLLCPCDPLEIFVNPSFHSLFHLSSLETEDKKLYYNLKSILTCVDLVHEKVDRKLLTGFEEKLYNLCSPISYASDINKSLQMEASSQFFSRLHSLLPACAETVSALNYLLAKLDLSADAKDMQCKSSTRYPAFANASSGISALCAGLSHFTKQRFDFCRDLLLFEIILYGSDMMENDQLDSLMLQSSIIPKTVALVRSYYIILWCTQSECVSVTPSVQDAAFKQFCVLEMPELVNSDLTDIQAGHTISHLFFKKDGGSKARKIMESHQSVLEIKEDFSTLFPSLVVAAATLLWPLEGNMFLEFLFAQCQYFPLQEYDRLLCDWCSWNKQYVNFLVGSSYLILGESDKALTIFLDVSKDIEGESLLCNKLLKGRYNSGSSVVSLYFMRVIQMFEQFSLSECVVKLASTALEGIQEDDLHRPIFYSILFKHHLNLGNSGKAFNTLNKNPDSSRRKDCLRQLIVKLCEVKQFQKIIELSYLAFEEDIVTILESRARCSDLSQNTSFYGILYALHFGHKKYRKAAAVMYELAMRFGREVIGLKGLRKQASCYLAAINCLHLAEPKYAWIVKPAANNLDAVEEMDYKNLPKRDADGKEVSNEPSSVKIEVLGLKDIQQEYNLIQARLLHAEKHRKSNLVLTPLSPEETIALLLNSCMFEAALQLSNSFSLSLVPVFEALAYRCLASTLHSGTYIEDQNTSLKPNDPNLDLMTTTKHNNAWHMLEKYLQKYEDPGKSLLHRCVSEKLLVLGAALPAWLRLSYQKRNFTELIALYICHGLLQDALELTVKYIKAVLGTRKEDFDLKFSLHANSPHVWLPHTYIDIILDAAEDLQDNVNIKDLHQELLDTLEMYNQTVESVTQSKLSSCLL
ncbi:nuclear pore complex protein Nup160-like [Uloborus diversus]|uniref:nuclear pore complex protein Nup160-like n=1 Tax=Uloborus diversus TaxID=327109 RepID=UPI00240971F2|nr:nuclear pore complex protein Nup160-like [Uloborus diversus]